MKTRPELSPWPAQAAMQPRATRAALCEKGKDEIVVEKVLSRKNLHKSMMERPARDRWRHPDRTGAPGERGPRNNSCPVTLPSRNPAP